MSNSTIVKELGFIADMIGLINNNYEDIEMQTRSEMMILCVERLARIRRDLAEAES